MRIPFFQKKKFYEEDSFLTGAIIVSAIVALVLGYIAWSQYRSDASYQRVGQSGSPQTRQGDERARALSHIPEEYRDLFSFPPSDSDVAQRRAHGEKVAAAAVDTTTLSISGCVGSPVVLRAQQGATITVVNEDSTEHELFIGPDPILTIQSYDSASLSYEFPNGKGTYVYGCDGSIGGIFIVS